MANFNKIKHIVYTEVSQRIFNQYLKRTEAYKQIDGLYSEWCEIPNHKTQKYTRWLKINRLTMVLTCKIGPKWFNLKTNLSKEYTEDYIEVVDPIRAYANFARIVKPLECVKSIQNLGAYQNTHQDKKGHYDYAICYDVNKSFFNACNNLQPTQLLRTADSPKKGEVGFLLNGVPVIGPSKTVCAYIFALEEHEGLKRYVEIYTKKLEMAKKDNNKQLEKKYKNEINFSIGNLANHNPFLRNMIVWYSNQFIESKVDENTIWSNTDSIVSIVRRSDLEIGNKVGQFKIEHEGEFIQNGTGYQWPADDKFSNKGVSKDQYKLFELTYGRQFRLDKDDVSMLNVLLLWRFNYEKEILEKVQIRKLWNSSLLKKK